MPSIKKMTVDQYFIVHVKTNTIHLLAKQLAYLYSQLAHKHKAKSMIDIQSIMQIASRHNDTTNVNTNKLTPVHPNLLSIAVLKPNRAMELFQNRLVSHKYIIIEIHGRTVL